MTTTFYLIRHAAHDLLGKVLAGRTSGLHLSETGKQQAESLADRLCHLPLAAIHSSPLERAQETASPIAARIGSTIVIQNALNEVDFGAWTGRTFDNLDRDPNWKRWNVSRSIMRPPGGETCLEVQTRIMRHIEALKVAMPGSQIVLVSHADVIRAALLHILGMAMDLMDRIEIDPASISTVNVDDWGVKIALVNGTIAL